MTHCRLSPALAGVGTAALAAGVTHPCSATVQADLCSVPHSAAASACTAAAACHDWPPAGAAAHGPAA